MKKLIVIKVFAFFISSTAVFAQDVIVKKSGEEIKAKVIEIGMDEVKYRSEKYLMGLIYTISKEDVNYIQFKSGKKFVFPTDPSVEDWELSLTKKYKIDNVYFGSKTVTKSGFYEGGIAITKEEFFAILSTNEKAFNKYKWGKTILITGVVLTAVGYCYLTYTTLGLMVSILPMSPKVDLPFEETGFFLITGIIGIVVGNTMKKNAVHDYNKERKTALDFKINPRGVGIVLRF